eukprot:SM000117S25508  [mRNA]  locus=s117:199314:200425:+ [translate_table: standard]
MGIRRRRSPGRGPDPRRRGARAGGSHDSKCEPGPGAPVLLPSWRHAVLSVRTLSSLAAGGLCRGGGGGGGDGCGSGSGGGGGGGWGLAGALLADRVVLEKLSVRRCAFRRGDVVVLRSPEERGALLVKRLIALPGDWVTVPGSFDVAQVPLALIEGRVTHIVWPPQRIGRVESHLPEGRVLLQHQ